ncbi:MAG: hypothetical protein GTN99_09880, partial [Candidatus Dadabacteria bacterium]|nr:hypothetical protein [Candidatus Dadabacteria bacterium]
MISKGEIKETTHKQQKTLKTPKKITDSDISSFLAGVSVGPVGDTRLAMVSYVSSDPHYASLAANSIVDTYIEWILQRRLGTSKSARQFLQTQLDQI